VVADREAQNHSERCGNQEARSNQAVFLYRRISRAAAVEGWAPAKPTLTHVRIDQASVWPNALMLSSSSRVSSRGVSPRDTFSLWTCCWI